MPSHAWRTVQLRTIYICNSYCNDNKLPSDEFKSTSVSSEQSIDHFSDQSSTHSHLILPTDLQSKTNNYSSPSHTTMNTCNWDWRTLCKALKSQSFPICTIHLPETSLWKNLQLWINIFCRILSQVQTIFSINQWQLIWYRANSYITYVARLKRQSCPRQNAEWHLHESEKRS